MLGRGSKWIVIVMLVLATGGHWMLLQSMAWVGMTVSFSRTDPLATALKKTFDGQHPCPVCKIVKQARETEQERKPLKLDTKFDLHFAAAVALLDPPLPPPPEGVIAQTFPVRTSPPPLPPPRHV